MKRRLLIIAILLLPGAVVNVAVAWAPCRWAWTRLYRWCDGEGLTIRQRSALWAAHAPAEWPSPPRDSVDGGMVWNRISTTMYAVDFSNNTIVLLEAGWPLRCVRSKRFFPEPRRANPIISGAIQLGSQSLPIEPIPLGFALNALFYATLLWLLTVGLFALRGVLRLRRGLCPKCVYPIGESPVCTECGKPLPSLT